MTLNDFRLGILLRFVMTPGRNSELPLVLILTSVFIPFFSSRDYSYKPVDLYRDLKLTQSIM